MASNNIILAVPSANSSVNYDLPPSDSAKLSFSPEDIDGLKLDGQGGLVISFVEGGNVTLTNFQSFIDNGNTLSLADGTQVDPKLLFNALGGQNDNLASGGDDVIKIGIPAENSQRDITLEPGKKYLLNFDLSETKGADVKDGKMVIGFENGGKIVINNYDAAMAGKTPPELSLASKTCVVTGDELITNIQALAKTAPLDETVVVAEEDKDASKHKSKIADADMQGKEDIGANGKTDLEYKAEQAKAEDELTEAKARQANEIKTAAGEDAIAQQLANIETAAGAAGGRANSGYGYGSRFAADPFVTNPDIGPINPTALNYSAPLLTPSPFLFDEDGNPLMIDPDAKFIDETNLANGPVSVSGDLNIDYGADGFGSVGPNGSFSSGGSQTGGNLSSHGVDINVVTTAGGYEGFAGGTKVFDLVINSNGSYTFTQYEQLDHANGGDPNDQIALNFGVVAADGDGDTVSTDIQIIIADDAPSASGAEETVDETDLGPIVETGSITVNFGQDGPGNVQTTNDFSASGSIKGGVLSSSGVPITVTSTATGYEGKANGVTVFTLAINPATGAYTYTQYKNLDHADGANPNDIINLKFGTKVVDYDGDSATAPIVIHVKDDAPIFQPPEKPPENPPENPPQVPGNPKPDKGLEIVDETNLKGGPVVETGKLNADFGGDVPGSYGFKDGSFASSGSKANNALTHNGVPVVVSLVNGEWVGKAGSLTVFKLEMNTTTGDYKFTLYDNLDHADKTNPDDQIVLNFGVKASDFDGDSADGSIRIIVKDDGPIAHNDHNTYDTTFGVANGNVITGLNGGPGAADTISTDSDLTAQQNSVVKIAFGNNEVDVPATGTVSINGEYGTLTIAADGTYTYKALADGGMVESEQKEFTSGPALPDFDESEALDGVEQQSLGVAPGNLSIDGGETVTVKFVSEQASYGNTMGVFTVGPDGKLHAETVLIKNGNAASSGQSFSYTAAGSASALGFFIVADGASANNGYAGIDFTKGSLNFVYDYGMAGAREATINDDGTHVKLVYTNENGVEKVINGPLYFTSDRGDMDNLNADGSVRVVSGIPGDDNHVLRIGFEDLPGLGDKDFNDIVFDVSIKGKDCGCGSPDIKDQFTYTLKDGDGDTDKAILSLDGKDLTDDKPILTNPAVKTVDETNLKDGSITEAGKITADFGHDGPGTIGANGSFSSTGSKLNGNLTSGGVAVMVALVGDTYVGKAGNVTVFSAQVKADGTYTFKLYEQLDHADGSNPNDEIALNFGLDATDCDGDKSHTTLTIKVKDDAPTAHDDTRTTDEGNVITGNVTQNDVPGQDTPATVTKVTFGGTNHDVPANGSNITIVGTNGTLVINNTGAYTYTSKNNADGTDNFTYTLTDRDGDSAHAVLSVCVNDTDTIPTIVRPGDETVDETNLKDGVVTETGMITADFKDDAPGSFGGNGSFTSGGSKLGGNLTSGGVPVVVSLNGNTYEGKAGGTTVFTLVINANGSYTFKLLEQLDHADGSNPNDIIDLNFGVIATDADGDKASTTLTVHVKDDAPVANDDSNTASEGGTVKGNVTNNDVSGQDTPATVTKVEFNGQNYNVPASGNVVINGQYGTLTIDKTGAYSYTAKSNNPEGSDNFNYTLKDNDGDVDTACLTIKVSPNDECPIIVKPADEIVDETNLKSGAITETGKVTANFFSDGPGSFAGNGSFTSGGSKLGNALTHNGVPVVVNLNGNTYTGTAGGVTVFTMAIAADGSYTFKLLDNLDHADGSNANDIISLNFGVKATDADGDAAATTITVQVKDDAPVANDDHNTSTTSPATGNVISGLNGGAGAADVLSQDDGNKVTKVSFGGNTVDVPSTGTATIEGANGTLKISADGSYTYTAHPGASSNGEEKTFVGGPALPDFDESEALDGVEQQSLGVAKGNLSVGAGDVITVNFAGTQAEYSNTLGVFTIDAQGRLKAETIVIPNAQTAGNGDHSYTAAGGAVATGFFIIADGADLNNGYAGLNLSKGSLDFVYKYGTGSAREATTSDNGADVKLVFTAENGTKTVLNGPVYFTSDRGDVSHLNADGSVRVVSGIPNGDNHTLRIGFEDLPQLGDKDYNDVVFDVSIKNKDCGCDNSDVFTYTLKDGDGDTDKATLTLDCITPPMVDDHPMIIKPADEIVDETSLSSGVITETGTVTANFFNDGPGAFAANNSFTSSGSRTNNALTSNGVAVMVTQSGNTYTGKAGGVTVFTMTIASNGAYTFKLLEQLDHADGSNANDIISLNFGVKATDADGDAAATTITVQVKDDAPDAKDDGRITDAGQTITGNVTGNDVVGQDTPGLVTKILAGGTTYNLTSANTVIATSNGTLTINNTGAYTYVGKSTGNGTDNFTYTLKDHDGDTDTANLCVEVKCAPVVDDHPVIIKPADEIVDETTLANGTITETGTVTANFFNDGPGTFAGNNSFASSGSKLNGALTSNGVAVNVTQSGNAYTGTAGGVTVFTMTIAANGAYTYKQFEQFDHADGSNPNDVIDLTFGVKATDSDGDSAATTITVHVKDDAPDAKDDGRITDAGQTITGNVTGNDIVGQDTPGLVTKIVVGGTTYNLGTANTVINAPNGTLTINSTGAYTYVAKASGNGTDNFTYTLKDRDGDTDTANLCVEVKCAPVHDDQPIIIKPADECVDETNLAKGTITEGGKVTANFGNDGPGMFAGNNSFTSGGSRLGGQLSSGGVGIVVTQSGNTYTGKAGNITVFTMMIAADGAYTFKLYEQLDHADKTNPNDIINLNFGVKATDADGDTASTTITVQVKDDAPVAHDDACTVFLHEKQVSSNALTNDVIGQDVAGIATAISFGGTTKTIPTAGTVDIAGQFGILTIAASGAYTYKITDAHCQGGSENFTLKIADHDGDTDTSNLQINVITQGMEGTPGDDVMHGTTGDDIVNGNAGADDLWGENGNDTIHGNAGMDNINGGQGSDILYGDADGDVVSGREGNDTLYGGTGDDDLYGDAALGDKAYTGNDKLYGEDGNDYMVAGRGDDYLDGGAGNDTLYGEDGVDTIIGGIGNDHLIGGAGNDILTGGAGSDTFWYMAINEGLDHIKDFKIADHDKLELSNVLTHFDPVTDAINDFVFATHSGNDTTILVNDAGTGIAGAAAVAVLENVNVNVTDLFNNGSIIV